MLIFFLVVGVGLCLRGVLALAKLYRWVDLPMTPAARRFAGAVHVLLGVTFILAGVWRPFLLGAFAAVVLPAVAERMIIVQRRVASR